MNKTRIPFPAKVLPAFFALVFFAVSCIPTLAQPTAEVQIVEVTREVTRDVTVEVIQEVTRIVEVPVTITPTFTPEITETPSETPTNTPLPGPTTVTTQASTQCLYGPSTVYLNKYTLKAALQLEAVGRSLDGAWLKVQTLDHKNPCWLKVTSVTVDAGDVTGLPAVDPELTPYSTKYSTALQAVSVNRVDKEVTIFWLPSLAVPEADYRGYLIEAWVCQSGQPVFVTKMQVPTFADNQANKMQFYLVVDEPGCTYPSHGRISVVTSDGYSKPKEIAWPDPNALPAPTATP